MSGIAHLCDHRARVHRATELRDELADVVSLWEALPAPDGLNCRPASPWAGQLQDRGPGEQQSERRTWFLVAEFDVQERDVLEVFEGPAAPALLRVLGVTRATAPIVVHHLEVDVEVWHGSLTEEPVTS
jgi:hypothetical protein